MKQQKSFGFTIVELMVVIVVIGVLSTIAVVGYSGWRKNTDTTTLKNDLTTVSAAMESSYTFNGSYPVALPATVTASKGVTLSGGGAVDGKSYCVAAVNSAGTYHIVNSGVPILSPCP